MSAIGRVVAMVNCWKSSRKFRIATFAAVIILLVLLFSSEKLSSLIHVELDVVEAMAEENTVLVMLIMLAIMLVQNVFTVVPSLLIISVNISLFGEIQGFAWSWISSIIGSSIVFFAARFWFQQLLVRRVPDKWLEKINGHGGWFVFIARIIPFMPTNVINIAAGISHLRYSHFLISTALGNFVFYLVVSLVSYGLISSQSEQVIYIVLFVAAVAIALALYRRKRAKSHQEDENHIEHML